MDHRKQQQRQSPSPRSGGGGRPPSSGKGGKAGGGGAGGKKPIKVVYISNPMRVKTSAAGFRALVQELTGRDADPSKYSTDDGAAQELSPEGSAAASTPGRPGTVAAGYQLPGVVAAAAFNGGEEEEGEGEEDDIFRAQLLDNDYPVFSPPTTLLYDYPPHSNKV